VGTVLCLMVITTLVYAFAGTPETSAVPEARVVAVSVVEREARLDDYITSRQWVSAPDIARDGAFDPASPAAPYLDAARQPRTQAAQRTVAGAVVSVTFELIDLDESSCFTQWQLVIDEGRGFQFPMPGWRGRGWPSASCSTSSPEETRTFEMWLPYPHQDIVKNAQPFYYEIAVTDGARVFARAETPRFRRP
jgi:hypothetical protein